MKIFIKITFLVFILFSIGIPFQMNAALVEITDTQIKNDLNTGNIQETNTTENTALDTLKGEKDFNVNVGGEKGIKNTAIKIAKDLKTIFYYIAALYFFFIILKLFFSGKTEEESSNFKNGILWISAGLIVTQIGYSFIEFLYDEKVGGALAYEVIDNIINPIISLLQTLASFFFIFMAIYAFFKIITANGDEEKANAGKKSVGYAIIGFIVIRFSQLLVETTYGKLNCDTKEVLGIFEISNNKDCIQTANLSDFTNIVVTIINWVNSFVGIIVVIMIIYAGSQVFLSAGDEEKLKKAKTSILYITIGVGILVFNYLILTFFIIPESII